MHTFWIALAALNLVVIGGAWCVLFYGSRRITWLRDVSPQQVGRWPAVSVIVAARNEQRDIEVALHSLLQLDYDDFEVLVVDDRSTDETGRILEDIARREARLQVYHVDQLPAGWLGKNHALHFGAERAGGEFLLFTDADVVMERSTLRRAMAYVLRNEADHVTVSPDAVMPTRMLEAFVLLFINLFSAYIRPWKVADPKSSAFVGIGAFNLVKREVYQAVGTHRTIAMRPDDDVKLGKIIKKQGFRQRFLLGRTMVRVPWYASVRELVCGMEKNAFAGVDYRISTVIALTAYLIAFDVWPFLATIVLRGPAQYLYLATVLVLLGQALWTAHDMGLSPWSAALFPLAVLLMIYIQWRAMVLAFLQDGIRWRDTHYSLAELRANKI
ncbi:MAG: glycosyltransferase family 2 protein [Pirellulaceae bacterium]